MDENGDILIGWCLFDIIACVMLKWHVQCYHPKIDSTELNICQGLIVFSNSWQEFIIILRLQIKNHTIEALNTFMSLELNINMLILQS